MNSDFRLSIGYFRHPKTQKLERLLGESAVLAHLHLLSYAALHRPTGELTNMDAEDIEIACGFGENTPLLVKTLITLRLLDQSDTDLLSIHDWADHQPDIIRTLHMTHLEALRYSWVLIRKEVSPRIFQRDGFQCLYCGSRKNLTIDHVIPVSRNGSNDDDNLVTACRSCNSRKHAKTPEEWNR